MSLEIDLHIAIEHGLMSIAGILHVSSSPCSEDDFRRVLARVRRYADIAAHYARRYLESGGPVPPRSFFQELEAILREERATSAAGAERWRRPASPRPGPNVLPFSRAEWLRTEPAPVSYQSTSPKALAAPGSTQDLAGALRLVIQGLHMFRRARELRSFR